MATLLLTIADSIHHETPPAPAHRRRRPREEHVQARAESRNKPECGSLVPPLLLYLQIAQRGFNGCKHYIQAQVYQVNPGQGDHQRAVDHDAGIQHMVQDFEKRDFIVSASQNSYGFEIILHQRQKSTAATAHLLRCAAARSTSLQNSSALGPTACVWGAAPERSPAKAGWVALRLLCRWARNPSQSWTARLPVPVIPGHSVPDASSASRLSAANILCLTGLSRRRRQPAAPRRPSRPIPRHRRCGQKLS